MSIFNRFRPQAKTTISDSLPLNVKKKSSIFSFDTKPEDDPDKAREQGRKVLNESLIAKNIMRRLEDNIINTGLTWESSPLWDEITDKPEGEEGKKAWTTKSENRWKLFARSKEADLAGQFTFQQLQRQYFSKQEEEGEALLILRYLNDPKRMSPVAIQRIDNDQIATDYDEDKGVTIRGGYLDRGMEFNAAGQIVAVWLREELGDDPIRIPFYGKHGRRFVIHYTNAPIRGISKLCKLVYELAKLADYDEAELEAVVASALWMGVVSADKDVKRSNTRGINITGGTGTSRTTVLPSGIEKKDIGGKALVLNTLPPGYDFKGFQPTRPNQNYEKFVEAFESRLAGFFGLPLSIYKQQMNGSYSAARAEILLFWNSVQVYRDNIISGLLEPFHEAVFSEWIKAGTIKAPGFNVPFIRQAWLYGSWNGISRPVVDPVKEVKAVESREKLGHTTGEKEAKAYNGSDFYENVQRRKVEQAALLDSEPTTESDGDPGDSAPSANDPTAIKTELDAYGVGVRAGAITPSVEDENSYRIKLGLPAISKEAKEYWKDEKNVRRPITLAMPGVVEDDQNSLGEDPDEETNPDEEGEDE